MYTHSYWVLLERRGIWDTRVQVRAYKRCNGHYVSGAMVVYQSFLVHVRPRSPRRRRAPLEPRACTVERRRTPWPLSLYLRTNLEDLRHTAHCKVASQVADVTWQRWSVRGKGIAWAEFEPEFPSSLNRNLL